MNISPLLLICPFFVLITLGLILLFFTTCKNRGPAWLFGISLLIRASQHLSLTACDYLPDSFIIVNEYLVGYLILLLDPIIFFAFMSYVFPVKEIFRRYWGFLLPTFVLGTFHFIFFASYPLEAQMEIATSFWNEDNVKKYTNVFTIQRIILLSSRLIIFFYLVTYTKILVFDFRKFLRSNFSNSARVRIGSLIVLDVLFTAFGIFYTFVSILDDYIIVPIIIMEVCLAFTIYYVVNRLEIDTELIQSNFLAFVQNHDKSFFINIFFPKLMIQKIANLEEENDDDMMFDKMEYLYQRLLKYFETEKPYLQKDLCLNDIARRLNSNRTYVSQLLTKVKNISFYDFVNTYRVEEAKQMIQEQSNLSLTCVAEDCGFNSYATFIKHFIKKEGISPATWRDKVQRVM